MSGCSAAWRANAARSTDRRSDVTDATGVMSCRSSSPHRTWSQGSRPARASTAPRRSVSTSRAASVATNRSRTAVRSRMIASAASLRRRGLARQSGRLLDHAFGGGALLYAAADHLAQLGVVLVAVDGHRVLRRCLEHLVLGVGRDRDRAVHLARDLPAIHVLAAHRILLASGCGGFMQAKPSGKARSIRDHTYLRQDAT